MPTSTRPRRRRVALLPLFTLGAPKTATFEDLMNAPGDERAKRIQGSLEMRGPVVLVLDPAEGATVGYLDENVVPDPDLQATGPIGVAAAVNVAPGFTDVSMTLGPGGPVLGQTTVPVRAGAVTTFGLRPTP